MVHIISWIHSLSSWNKMQVGQNIDTHHTPNYYFCTGLNITDVRYIFRLRPPYSIILTIQNMKQVFCRLVTKDGILPVLSRKMVMFPRQLKSFMPLCHSQQLFSGSPKRSPFFHYFHVIVNSNVTYIVAWAFKMFSSWASSLVFDTTNRFLNPTHFFWWPSSAVFIAGSCLTPHLCLHLWTQRSVLFRYLATYFVWQPASNKANACAHSSSGESSVASIFWQHSWHFWIICWYCMFTKRSSNTKEYRKIGITGFI